MRALYISHNGMLENLGQAQVLPYLRGLARRGVTFDLFSYELASATDLAIEELRGSLDGTGIHWTPLRRANDHRLQTKLIESSRGVLKALATALARRPSVVHGRSYVPTAISDLVASLVPGARLLFDCRGMLGDEYVDAGYWTEERLEYRLLKRYERRAFRRADGIVFLTDRLRRLAHERGWTPAGANVEAIPCCVDLERFRFDEAARTEVRRELGLEDRLVVVYSGSLGGWYQEDEMARFVGAWRRAAGKPIAMLVLTHQDTTHFASCLTRAGIAADEIVFRKVRPVEMSRFLSAGDVALSFIKSCFSKLGSSPTKVAEYLACGLPVVLNGDIGDQQDLAEETDACVVLDTLGEREIAAAAARALPLATAPLGLRVGRCRAVAERRFDLESVGVARYERLYRRITT